MEIFLDSSDIKEIRGLNKANLVDGITTNPSLLASAKTDFKILLKEICSEIFKFFRRRQLSTFIT